MDDFGVEFEFPEDLKGLALGIVVDAREGDEGGVVGLWRGSDLEDEELAFTEADEFAWGGGIGKGLGIHGDGRGA